MSDIRTRPVTKAYEDVWVRVFAKARTTESKPCQHCGAADHEQDIRQAFADAKRKHD